MIPVLGSQPAGDVSHKPSDRLPLLSARPAVTPATLKRAATILLLGEQSSAYSKRVPRTKCALRIKSVHPGFPRNHENTMPETAFLGAQIASKSLSAGAFAPDPTRGAYSYSAAPDLLAGFKGPYY